MDKVKPHTVRVDQLRNKEQSNWSIEESSHTAFEYVQDSIRNALNPNDANKTVSRIHVKAFFLSMPPETVRNSTEKEQN